MAHFAKLDENNTVVEVVVVHNNDAPNEGSGVLFLEHLFGYSNWKQCSYSGSIRKQFPGIGFTYDPVPDVFVAPQPFPSWSLDTNHDWQAPTPKPEGMFQWDEASLAWVNS